jgi:phosphotransferase system HPr (HPr) family protein
MNPVPWQREVTVTTPNSTPPTNTPSPGCPQRKVILANPNGLHMRPSAQVVQLAEQFRSSVTIHCEGRAADGKSIWELLALAAMPGSELTVEADGPDADAALDALTALLATVPPEE